MKASKKLIGASVALVAALAVSVGTTYAWFTTNRKVTVSNIEAVVTTGDSNLEIRRMDANGNWYAGSSWSYSLDLAEDDYLKNIVLDQATSKNTENGSKLYGKDFEEIDAEDATSFIDLYFAFRTPAKTGSTVEIILSTNSAVESEGNEDAQNILGWDAEDPDYGTEISFGDPIEAKAADAARVAFFNFTVTESTSESDQTITRTKGSETAVGVWNPNEGAGYDEVNETTGHVLSHDVELILAGKTDAELPDGDDTIDAYYDTATYGNYEKKLTKGTTTVVTITGNDAAQYCYGYVHVRIWLEGTDGDCLNNIFGDTIQINLGFEIKGTQNNG